MHKLFKKGIAAAMGLALSLTCLLATAVPVKAEDYMYVYRPGLTVGETGEGILPLREVWEPENEEDGKVECKMDGDCVSIYFPKAWNMTFYDIPQEILDAGLISAHVEYGDDERVVLGFTKDDEKYIGVAHAFGAEDIDPLWNLEADMTEDDIKDIKVFKFMDGEDNKTIRVKSVTFYTEDEVPGAPTELVGEGGSSTPAESEADDSTVDESASSEAASTSEPASSASSGSNSSSSSSDKSDESGFPVGAVVGIIIAVVVIGGIVFVVMKGKKK